jgi:hypothetical protein
MKNLKIPKGLFNQSTPQLKDSNNMTEKIILQNYKNKFSINNKNNNNNMNFRTNYKDREKEKGFFSYNKNPNLITNCSNISINNKKKEPNYAEKKNKIFSNTNFNIKIEEIKLPNIIN